MTIHELLPKVMEEVGTVGKHGFNEQQGYAFVSYGDVATACQGAFVKHGISVATDILATEREQRETRSGGTLNVALLTIAFTFSAPDGSSVTVTTVGEGADSGDKASNKAMTAALKYALRTLLVIPDAEDGDADSPEETTKAKAPARKTAPTSGDADDPYRDVLLNPSGWFDNRTGKRSPKAPDFKAKTNNKAWAKKGTEKDGSPGPMALWLSDAPPGFVEALESGDASLCYAEPKAARGKTAAEAVEKSKQQAAPGEEPF